MRIEPDFDLRGYTLRKSGSDLPAPWRGKAGGIEKPTYDRLIERLAEADDFEMERGVLK